MYIPQIMAENVHKHHSLHFHITASKKFGVPWWMPDFEECKCYLYTMWMLINISWPLAVLSLCKWVIYTTLSFSLVQCHCHINVKYTHSTSYFNYPTVMCCSFNKLAYIFLAVLSYSFNELYRLCIRWFPAQLLIHIFICCSSSCDSICS
jgi:hypothetical protein